MTTLWQRFLYVDPSHRHKVNVLAYPFVFSTFLYGVGFTFLGFWGGVHTSSLFQALYTFSAALPVLWGIAAIVAAGLSIALILSRSRGYGEWAAMLGFCVWFFAGLIYLFNGFWLVLFSVAVPNIYFWVYFYIISKQYKRRH